MASTPTVAVIGAGISGLTAAYVLRRSHQVTVYEAENRLGGHAHTHGVKTTDGKSLAIDSGFVAFSKRTSPNLVRLFRELGVVTQKARLSMSVTCDGCGLAYADVRAVGVLLVRPSQAFDLRYLKMLGEVPRFHRRARGVLDGEGAVDLTWGAFLEEGEFSPYFVQHYAVPLVACVWSSGDSDARGYPARHLLRYLDSHGMLSPGLSAKWRSVTGGSATYVEKLTATLEDLRPGLAVVSVTRREAGVDVRTAAGSTRQFDKVVIATHADDALAILTDTTGEEAADLAAIRYATNPTWLHRDGSVLPERSLSRASLNLRKDACESESSGVLVNYWMNRLQRVKTADDLVVTLNPGGQVAPESIIAKVDYRHPVFTPAAVEAAGRLRSSGGERLAFAGAHLGWGFHEDGCASGVEAARKLGVEW